MAITVQIIAEGKEALDEAQAYLKFVRPIKSRTEFGDIEFPIGSFHVPTRQFILGSAGPRAFYLHDNKLKAMGIERFAENMALGLFYKDLFDRTKLIIPMAETMAAFCVGIGLGMASAGLVGLITVTKVLIKLYIFYEKHGNDVKQALAHTAALVEAARWLSQHAPITAGEISKMLGSVVWEAICTSPKAISPKAVAPVFGAMIGGVARASDDLGEEVLHIGAIHLCNVLKEAVKKSGTAFSSEVAINIGKITAQELVAAYRKNGRLLNSTDARLMAAELQRAGASDKLNQLYIAADGLAAEIETMAGQIEAAEPPIVVP